MNGGKGVEVDRRVEVGQRVAVGKGAAGNGGLGKGCDRSAQEHIVIAAGGGELACGVGGFRGDGCAFHRRLVYIRGVGG